MEIVDSSISVPTGYVQEGTNSNVGFSVSLSADSNAGTAVGSNLWQITTFASANSDGSGTRYDEQAISLSSSQSGTTLNYGQTATISGLSYPLDLSNGPTCSQFGYICAEIEKGSSASPDFDLTPTITTTCTAVECRGENDLWTFFPFKQTVYEEKKYFGNFMKELLLIIIIIIITVKIDTCLVIYTQFSTLRYIYFFIALSL